MSNIRLSVNTSFPKEYKDSDGQLYKGPSSPSSPISPRKNSRLGISNLFSKLGRSRSRSRSQARTNSFEQPPPRYEEHVEDKKLAGQGGDSHQQPIYDDNGRRIEHGRNQPNDDSNSGAIFSKIKQPFKKGQAITANPSVSVDELPEDLNLLAVMDTVFIIDDSTSMTLRTGIYKDIYTHWEQTLQVVSKVVPLCAEYDSDGVDIHFLNAKHFMKGVKDAKLVERLFKTVVKEPYGFTPMARRMREICESYVQACEGAYKEATKFGVRKSPIKFPKPRNCIIITDGQADDPYAVWDIIVEYANRLDRIDAPIRQLGFQFFQVGDLPGVSHYLSQLDNAVKEMIAEYHDSEGRVTSRKQVRDIVDTVPGDRLGPQGLTDSVIVKTVIGAVSRSFDEQLILQYRSRIRSKTGG